MLWHALSTWRVEILNNKALAIGTFVGLTALSARISVQLPGIPVPLTMQVLAVLLSGLVLGPIAGATSQLVYLAAIASGLPLDAKGMGSLALVGPTAGYLCGFVPAAAMAGLATRLNIQGPLKDAVGILAGLASLYVLGSTWLAIWLGKSLSEAMRLGVLPFIVPDLAKGVLALVISTGWRARALKRHHTGG